MRIRAAQSRGKVVQQATGVVFAIVEEPAHRTESLSAQWGESASWSHLVVSEIHKAKATDSLSYLAHQPSSLLPDWSPLPLTPALSQGDKWQRSRH